MAALDSDSNSRLGFCVFFAALFVGLGMWRGGRDDALALLIALSRNYDVISPQLDLSVVCQGKCFGLTSSPTLSSSLQVASDYQYWIFSLAVLFNRVLQAYWRWSRQSLDYDRSKSALFSQRHSLL